MNKSLLEQIKLYNPFNEQEAKDKILILKFMNDYDDVLTRDNIFGHFSASAFVINEDLTKTLVVHHNIFKGLVYPGGHADGESDLLSVAIKEVCEETGLEVKPLIDNNIFSIQIIPINGHIKKGEYISSHLHFDVVYLLVAKNIDMNKVRVLESENSQVRWINLEDSYGNEAVDFIRPINKKIIKKIKGMELI